jgi:hypothetical protein
MAKTISGSDWMKAAGHKPVGVTLPAELHERAGRLAESLGVSQAALGRALFRWAVGAGRKKVEKILKTA